jgi:hypothetical protein
MFCIQDLLGSTPAWHSDASPLRHAYNCLKQVETNIIHNQNKHDNRSLPNEDSSHSQPTQQPILKSAIVMSPVAPVMLQNRPHHSKLESQIPGSIPPERKQRQGSPLTQLSSPMQGYQQQQFQRSNLVYEQYSLPRSPDLQLFSHSLLISSPSLASIQSPVQSSNVPRPVAVFHSKTQQLNSHPQVLKRSVTNIEHGFQNTQKKQPSPVTTPFYGTERSGMSSGTEFNDIAQVDEFFQVYSRIQDLENEATNLISRMETSVKSAIVSTSCSLPSSLKY